MEGSDYVPSFVSEFTRARQPDDRSIVKLWRFPRTKIASAARTVTRKGHLENSISQSNDRTRFQNETRFNAALVRPDAERGRREDVASHCIVCGRLRGKVVRLQKTSEKMLLALCS